MAHSDNLAAAIARTSDDYFYSQRTIADLIDHDESMDYLQPRHAQALRREKSRADAIAARRAEFRTA